MANLSTLVTGYISYERSYDVENVHKHGMDLLHIRLVIAFKVHHPSHSRPSYLLQRRQWVIQLAARLEPGIAMKGTWPVI